MESITDLALGICRLLVKPLGSNRMWLNFEHRSSSGTPYCSAIETAVAKASISPAMVDPCFAIGMKISPGIWVSGRSEEHTSELQSRGHLVCRLLLGKQQVAS